jgi:hypothetical protein
VGMGIRSVEADQGITPTIAHAPARIVHGLRPRDAGLELVPSSLTPQRHKLFCRNVLSLDIVDYKNVRHFRT